MGRRGKLRSSKAVHKLRKEEAEFDQREQQDATTRRELKAQSRVGAKQLARKIRKKNRRQDAREGIVASKSDDNSTWYKVRAAATEEIPDKEFLIESFSSMIEEKWTMFGYHKSTASAKFFVQGSSLAHSIAALSKRIKSAGGSVLVLTIAPCTAFMQLNIHEVKVLREVLASRLTDGILDLSGLQLDPRLLAADILLVMADADLLKQVMIQVRNHFPHVNHLVLGNNSLHLSNVRSVVSLLHDLPLGQLDLRYNHIASMLDTLKVLSPLSLVTLQLAGNPCLWDIREPARLLGTVRTSLPLLQELDGQKVHQDLIDAVSMSSTLPVEVALPVSMPVTISTTVPVAMSDTPVTTSTPVILSDELVKKFLEQFYACLDSSERSQLLTAYTPEAEFGVDSEMFARGRGSGHEVVAAGLSALPGLTHQADTFTLDQVCLQPALAQYVVRGRAGLDGAGPLSFAHSFCIVPYNAGVGCSLSLFEYTAEVAE